MEAMELINQIFLNLSNPFFLGLISAFTPCTIAVIPIFLYRFGFMKKDEDLGKNYFGLLLAIVGFLVSFGLTGLVFQQLILSNFANMLRLVLGSLLILMGFMQLFKILDFQMLNRFQNPLLLGAGLPWILSFSPCTLVFTAKLISDSSSATSHLGAMMQFLLFGAGMLVPVVLFVLVGSVFTWLTSKSQGIFHWLDRISAWLIILTGFYLSSQLVQVTSSEVVGGGLMLTFFVGWLMIRKTGKKGITLAGVAAAAVVLLSLLATAAAALITRPYDSEAVSGLELAYACQPGDHANSPVAVPVALIFGCIVVIVAVWYRWGYLLNRVKLDLVLTN